MRVVTAVEELRPLIAELKSSGKKIGFVPTMGYLHEGHLELVRSSKRENDATVVSIFVNPTQFAPNEDFSKYPRNEQRDIRMLSAEDVDILFTPTADEIYPTGFQSFIHVETLSAIAEGKARPTHFRGVTTIVGILFHLVSPDNAYFGQKDAQQARIISAMARDLFFPVSIRICPIVREPDGLAMSSRNVYLSAAHRMDALVLSRSLDEVEALIRGGERNAAQVINSIEGNLKAVGSAQLDYVRVVHSHTFEDAGLLFPGYEYYILLACRFDKTRLIDNRRVAITPDNIPSFS